MTALNKQALRKAAEKATPGPWEMEQENIWFKNADGYTKHMMYAQQGDDVDDKQDHYNTAFISAANPATVLALLDELEVISKSEWKLAGDLTEAQMNNTVLEKKLEAAEKRIAEQQKTLNAARSYVKSHAAVDGHAFGVLQAIDRAAGIGVKGE